jgi:hypothetical protein
MRFELIVLMRFLPEVAKVVNTIRPSCSPTWITPFDVIFARRPHWLTESLLNVNNKLVDEHGNALP